MTIRTLGLALALTAALPASLAAQTTDPQQLAQSVRTLASDLFEGRAPGTIGEERTIGYLVGRFQALGLEPGGPDGQWVQSVPLLHTRLGKAERLGIAQGDVARDWAVGDQVYLSTLQPKDKVVVDAAPLVFVGYGVSAPERGWDDYKDVDLKGKVAVFLINDPDFEATKGEDAFGAFGGRAMTYYGRWTYKFEEAARRGAIGALIVHDTPGAGYGWNVVVSPGGENYDLVRPADKLTSLAVQGWVEGDAAKALFAGASLDLAALRKRARSKAFRPVELTGARFSAAFPVTQEVVQSANVLARIGTPMARARRTHRGASIAPGRMTMRLALRACSKLRARSRLALPPIVRSCSRRGRRRSAGCSAPNIMPRTRSGPWTAPSPT